MGLIAPLDLFEGGGGDLISTLAICYGFKSVSFADPDFPVYLLKHIKNRARNLTNKERMKKSVWVNSETMCFDNNHRESCKCLGNHKIDDIIKECGVKSLVTFHNLEDLSLSYKKIKTSKESRNRVLELESMKTIQGSLNLNQVP